jgi:hypothetical protein
MSSSWPRFTPALASWIAARRVHTGGPADGIEHVPLPGLASAPSFGEFTVNVAA